MQDPEFEKKVSRKMEELKFSPSESVWLQVEKQILADRRRRKPLLWIFFVTGLFLVGGSFFLIHHKTKSENTVAHEPDRNMESPAPRPAKQFHGSSDSGSNTTGALGNRHVQSSNNFNSVTREKELRSLRLTKNKAEIKRSASSAQKQRKITNQTKAADVIAENELQYDNRPATSFEQSAHSLILPSETAKPENKTQSSKHEPRADSVRAKPIQSSPASISSKHPWAMGFSLDPGISSLKYDLTNYGSQLLYYPVTGSVNPGINSSHISTKPGVSFAAGIWFQKNLSRNVYLSLGLNYHYYSNMLTLTTSSGYSSSVNELSYTDQFHFFELPAGLGFRLSRNNKFPLFAELGFSLSQLLSTNAGQFNSLSGIYSPNADRFRHFQVMLNAALMLDISSRKHAIFMGPTVQYGIQNLLTQGGNNAEHLFFAGLRLNYSIKK